MAALSQLDMRVASIIAQGLIRHLDPQRWNASFHLIEQKSSHVMICVPSKMYC